MAFGEYKRFIHIDHDNRIQYDCMYISLYMYLGEE